MNNQLRKEKIYYDFDFRGWYIVKKSKESGKLYKHYILTDKETFEEKFYA